MESLRFKFTKVLAWLAFGLCVAQVVLTLASWLMTAAMPDVFMHSLLSAEGIRWFFGRFQDNLSSAVLVWLLLGSMAYGMVCKSGILHFDSSEYLQRISMRLVGLELLGFVAMMLSLTLLPHAILLNVMGGLFPSSFSQSLVPYCCLSVVVMCGSFGVMSGRLKGIPAIFAALSHGIALGAPLFVVYVLASQLYFSFLFFISS